MMFLVVGLMVESLNLAGVPSVAVQIPWNLFLIGTVIVSIYMVAERTVQARVAGGCQVVRRFPA